MNNRCNDFSLALLRKQLENSKNWNFSLTMIFLIFWFFSTFHTIIALCTTFLYHNHPNYSVFAFEKALKLVFSLIFNRWTIEISLRLNNSNFYWEVRHTKLARGEWSFAQWMLQPCSGSVQHNIYRDIHPWCKTFIFVSVQWRKIYDRLTRKIGLLKLSWLFRLFLIKFNEICSTLLIYEAISKKLQKENL